MRIFGKSERQYDTVARNRFDGNTNSEDYTLQGCDWRKKLRCASAVAACAATCAAQAWPLCVLCFAEVGASDCVDCV
jgi:hypothetical protein